MDTAERKSFELQAKVRQNAEIYRNSINDLYSWEKEIKDKEKDLSKRSVDDEVNHFDAIPVRSQVKQLENSEQAPKGSRKEQKIAQAETPTEKDDTAPDPVALSRKEANECKDRGNMYVKLADYANALHEYTLAIELFGEEPIYYANRALVFLRMERYDECIEDCNRAIALDSLSVKAYYRRMQANESLGNNMDALRDCTSVLMIEPKNAEAKRSLDRINERLKKHVKAAHGPNFTPERSDLIDISPIEMPAYKRSNKPLKRIQIAEIVTARDTVDTLKISDEDIDKLFNSNCGPFVEVKKGEQQSTTVQAESVKATEAQETNKKVVNKAEVTKEKAEIKVKEKCESGATETEKIVEDRLAAGDNNTAAMPNKTENPAKPKRPLPAAPTSSAQFYANWKELTPEQKYDYLKSINLAELSKILGAGFSSDTLTDIINTLHDFYVPNKDPKTAATLLEVSKNNQVNILSLLMSSEDEQALGRVLNSFAHNPEIDDSIVKRIIKNFNLK